MAARDLDPLNLHGLKYPCRDSVGYAVALYGNYQKDGHKFEKEAKAILLGLKGYLGFDTDSEPTKVDNVEDVRRTLEAACNKVFNDQCKYGCLWIYTNFHGGVGLGMEFLVSPEPGPERPLINLEQILKIVTEARQKNPKHSKTPIVLMHENCRTQTPSEDIAKLVTRQKSTVEEQDHLLIVNASTLGKSAGFWLLSVGFLETLIQVKSLRTTSFEEIFSCAKALVTFKTKNKDRGLQVCTKFSTLAPECSAHSLGRAPKSTGDQEAKTFAGAFFKEYKGKNVIVASKGQQNESEWVGTRATIVSKSEDSAEVKVSFDDGKEMTVDSCYVFPEESKKGFFGLRKPAASLT